ncbi:hypothetical protein LguiA_017531 [Lonicera macranthoides]
MGYCAFFVVLMIFQEFGCIEGRHLRSKMCKKYPKEKYNLKGGAKSSKEINSSSKVDVVEDFRPTTPGHSPGLFINKMIINMYFPLTKLKGPSRVLQVLGIQWNPKLNALSPSPQPAQV